MLHISEINVGADVRHEGSPCKGTVKGDFGTAIQNQYGKIKEIDSDWRFVKVHFDSSFSYHEAIVTYPAQGYEVEDLSRA